MQRAFPASAPVPNPVDAKRTDAGWAGCSFKHVEVLKTRRKQDHSHPEVEILLVLSGRGTCIVGESLGDFKKGDLYLIGSRLAHTFFQASTEEEVKTLIIQFKPEVFRPFLSAFPEFRGLDDLLAKARRGLKVLGRTRETIEALMPRIGDYPPASLKRLNLFLSILAELMESGELAVVGGPTLLPMRKGRMDEKLDLACRLIQANLMNPLSQAYMAEQVAMSPAAFSRWFKRHMGKSYTGYTNQARIDLICRALLDTDRDIGSLSRDFGFSGERHFHKVFKSIKGVSPSEFRRSSPGS